MVHSHFSSLCMLGGVRWPSPFHFCQKRMLIKIAGGDPLVYTFFIKNVKGVAFETPSIIGLMSNLKQHTFL
jgi:hypothetical protein